MSNDNIILETRDLTKHYGGVHALEGANFTIRRGEHVAIMGDNGAGKSTFVRQLTGVEQPSRGQIVFDGRPVHFAGPIEAREAGIETVFQTLALADDLDVPDNLFLGRELIKFKLGPFSILDYKAMRERTLAGLLKTAVKIPNLKNTIRNMSGGQRQCVAIARTATFHSKLTIMDEPTAALGVQETAQVENIIRTLKEAGEPLILISHNMRQVFDLVDRIVVFRRGRIVANLNKQETDGQDVVAYITGAKTGAEYQTAEVSALIRWDYSNSAILCSGPSGAAGWWSRSASAGRRSNWSPAARSGRSSSARSAQPRSGSSS
jgi:fructose transport system ATP-binding protein